VNLADELEPMSMNTVTFDNRAVGRCAALHLAERELERFAFVGPKNRGYGVGRFEGFQQELQRTGLTATALWTKDSVSEERQGRDVEPIHYADFVRQLEPPVGIFTAHDLIGYGLLSACHDAGLRVPEDVCVVSADNDEILCDLTNPPLSSIAHDAKRLGTEAAAVLEQLMRGEEPEERVLRIPPVGVVGRQSSDRLAIGDPHVAEALRYIRNHADRFIDVPQVLGVVPICRRSLERRFQEYVGRGIYREIRRVHVERAKKLLRETDWPVHRIARNSGFNSIHRFEDSFRQEVGASASEFRKQQEADPKD
jgi:LacI family transcriptional regulator